ncbi:hypothetical protein PR003_g6650 [Phytophthora rubi]|uniref:CCHC-type domain-containing protein n=1 Tax=Phytophthora rubi TaxID=129364 RepID=A0A6A3J5M5_9STRA|nr:hypothetical protein PR002_g22023 [Phytophthora rubi]KAE8990347.1 hypothetical protein PR001_g21512 [Phytophthora rubi]KAE9347964.1 hypothetical protein PR003_g6650 [Phytophthora rubi]
MVGTPPPSGQAGQQQPAGQPQQVGQQQQQQAANGGARTRRAGGSKPPKYTEDGGFDLYHAQIEGYLLQHECWDVVGGNAVANENDPQWVEKNQFARYALLFGMLPKDSKKVCKMAAAREMWTSFEQDKTKRAYASETRLRRDLYVAKYTPGEDMEKYLDRLDDMRRRLENMNAVVTDEEMVKVILQGVVDSHRNVVRMFDRNNGGAAPDLATVRNVLLGEAETDKACATEAAKEEVVKATKLMTQRPVAEHLKKKFKKGKNKKVSGDQETRKCFFCKKKGHLRAECFGWKALQKKKGNEPGGLNDGGNGSKNAAPMRLVWTGELGDSDNPPVPIRMVKNQAEVPTVASAHDWLLDSGAGAHVCVHGGSFVRMDKDPLVTLDWQGGVDTNEYSGLVRLEVHPGKFLDLHAVRYAPGGTVNLVSQRLLEQKSWKPSYSDTDNERLRCKYFDKGGVRLEFKKKGDGFYWMKASPVLTASMMVIRSVETLEDNIVMTWHLKLAHLNEAAMKKMVLDGLAEGMNGLTMDDFKKTPLKCKWCLLEVTTQVHGVRGSKGEENGVQASSRQACY